MNADKLIAAVLEGKDPEALINEAVDFNAARGTQYFKKLVSYVQSQIPGATADEVFEAEQNCWSSGSNKILSGRALQVLRLVEGGGLVQVIGSDMNEFNEYAKLMGVA